MRTLPHRFSLRFGPLVLFPLLVGIIGCSEPDTKVDRKPVSGKVTFGGKTDQSGMVRFIPLEGGVAAVADIEEGKYQFPESAGPEPGKYEARVRIREMGGPGVGRGAKGGAGGGGSGSTGRANFLPERSQEVIVPSEPPYVIAIDI